MRIGWWVLLLRLAGSPQFAAGAPSFMQTGNVLVMSNANVQVQYNLATGTADFYWQNAKKISAFYSGVTLNTGYLTGSNYASRSWAILSADQVVVTNTGAGLPAMKQYFTLDQSNSFLTRVEMSGSGLSANWMGPLVMSTPGGVDIGSYNDNRALFVPFDNDHFVRYNAESMNGSDTGNEAGAFYDSTTRNGLVVGSVTHDTWKTGVYWSGSNNKLDKLNVFGGVTSHWTWDVMPHGSISGNTISSPTVFIGFGPDWREMMEVFADENALFVPKLGWTNGVPFGWNSWGFYQTTISYANAVAVSDSIHTNLQPYGFADNGTVYVNLDSYWNNLSDSQLQSFTAHCHANGQKAGVYWGPFVFWGNANDAANYYVPPDYTYAYSDILLTDTNGNFISNDGAFAIDPTHPGTQAMIDYFASYYLGLGFDYVKLDFLSHGALEGVHYDPAVTTGIQAYNQGLQRLTSDLGGRMFLSESIAPIFPYQYAHSRRIACDAQNSRISDTEYTLNSVSYGWWLDRLYCFNDPDIMVFAKGANANEQQSRLISGAVTGLFLDGDSLSNSASISAAQACLTNAAINAVARAAQTFRPVEGNTGSSATDLLVKSDGTNWYVAVFNYTSSATNKTVDFSRAGIPAGIYTATDLWSAASSVVSGSLNVSLNAKQSKLFKLALAPNFNVSATPASRIVGLGGASTSYMVMVNPSNGFNSNVNLGISGLPPGAGAGFNPGTISGGSGSSTLTVTTASSSPKGNFPLLITGASSSLTNTTSATLVIGRGPANLQWASTSSTNWDVNVSSNWFDLGAGTRDQFYPGDSVLFDDTPGVVTGISVGANVVTPAVLTNNSSANNFTLNGSGKLSGAMRLVKLGGSTLTLNTANDFTGDISVLGGTLRAWGPSGLGATNGTLTVAAGATLDRGWSMVKPIVVSGAGTDGNGALVNNSSGNVVWDDASGGLTPFLTLAGDVTFGGNTRWDLGGPAGIVVTTGGSNYSVSVVGTTYHEWRNLAMDANLGNINVNGGPGITLGIKGTTTLGNPTNTLSVFGPNGRAQFWNDGSVNVVVNKRVQLYDAATLQNGGGTTSLLAPVVLGMNAGDNCTFNIGGTSLTVSGAVSGPGNLVKLGGSPLYLAAANTCAGHIVISNSTLALLGAGSISNCAGIAISAGSTLDVSGRPDQTLTLASGQVLQGYGTLNGSLAVSAGATIAPGDPSTVGTLTVTNAVRLSGATVMKLNKTSATNDVVRGAAGLTYGGTLSLTNLSGALAAGDRFSLFSAAVYAPSTFSAISPPTPGLGLAWDTSSLTNDGTLKVVLGPPTISSLTASKTTIAISGGNGAPNGTYRVLASTNLTWPRSNWMQIGAGSFNSVGTFTFSVSNNPAESWKFYLLQVP